MAQNIRASILVVEDDPASRTLISTALENENHVTVVSDGQDALKAVESNAPELVLLDVDLPGLTGIEICRRLKQNPRTAHIPVIFLTSLSSANDELTGLEVGGTDYLTKPIDPRVLRLRVQIHLKRGRAGATLSAGTGADDTGPLTEKERECLQWTSSGKTAWETAVITGRSRRTVEFHLRNAMRKLGATNVAHAAATAIRLGLL